MVKRNAIMIKRIIIVMTIFQIIFMPISNAGFWDDVVSTGKAFINTGSTSNNLVASTELKFTVNQIYDLLIVLAIVVSVLIGSGLGIKFMIGSVEEQAKTKELLFPYVIGCIVTFGAFGIWKILINVLSKI